MKTPRWASFSRGAAAFFGERKVSTAWPRLPGSGSPVGAVCGPLESHPLADPGEVCHFLGDLADPPSCPESPVFSAFGGRGEGGSANWQHPTPPSPTRPAARSSPPRCELPGTGYGRQGSRTSRADPRDVAVGLPGAAFAAGSADWLPEEGRLPANLRGAPGTHFRKRQRPVFPDVRSSPTCACHAARVFGGGHSGLLGPEETSSGQQTAPAATAGTDWQRRPAASDRLVCALFGDGCGRVHAHL